MNKLTIRQIETQDSVDNKIFNLVLALNPTTKEIPWNIEMIADIRETIRFWLVEHYKITDEMTFYPFWEV